LRSEDPPKDKMLEARFLASNQRVERLPKKKGFGIAGDEPGGVQINRILRVGSDERRCADRVIVCLRTTILPPTPQRQAAQSILWTE